MTYTPGLDAAWVFGLLGAAVVLVYDLVACWYFGRKSDAIYRLGAMWGGE